MGDDAIMMPQGNSQRDGGVALSMRMTVSAAGGLHARPAGRIVQAVQCLNATVVVCYKNRYADALSVIELMALSVPQGGELLFIARGPDAHKALTRIAEQYPPCGGEDAWPEP